MSSDGGGAKPYGERRKKPPQPGADGQENGAERQAGENTDAQRGERPPQQRKWRLSHEQSELDPENETVG